MIKGNFFDVLLVIPILNLLVLLYKGFLFLKLPGAFGWAIIGLTIIIRFLLEPFFHKQFETMKKFNQLKPQINKLAKKYKNDQQKLQQEQLKLYQQVGINPALGCLLPLVQMPIFIALYNTLSLFLLNGNGVKVIEEINRVVYFSFLKITLIDPWFFGFNLALSPAKSGQWYYLLIPLVTAFLQYYQTKLLTPTPTSEGLSLKKETSSQDNKEDFQKALNNQMKFMFPAMIAFISYSLPVGLALYWNIFSLMAIWQQKKLKVNN